MLKPPSMPNLPGMSAMTDTFEFVKNLWGGMSMPGMVMPTLSVDEINKQIKDLKAVEAWLNVNMNMLRGTIQALEVQAATIATLQSMGETLSSAAKSGTGMKSAPPPAPVPAVDEGEDEEMEDDQASDLEPKLESRRRARNELKAEFKGETQPPVKPDTSPPVSAEAANYAAPLANPAVWWNMLQDQFKQGVTSAMVEPPKPSRPAKSAAKSSAPRKRKSSPKP